MSVQRVSKRSLSAAETDHDGSPIKKLRRSPNPVVPFETPFPTELSLSQTFRLPSSRGSHISPSNMSPVKSKRNLDTSKWKENSDAAHRPRALRTYGGSRKTRSVRGGTKRTALLESPFSVNSSSSSPNKESSHGPTTKTRLGTQKRTLSDTGFLQNLPAVSHSTTTSPLKMDAGNVITLHRRPSEPVMSHAQEEFQFPAGNFASAPQNQSAYMDSIFSLNVDFNRPPSQLSMYDYNLGSGAHDEAALDINLDGFFAGMQCASTPHARRTRRGKDLVASSVEMDEDSDEDSIFGSADIDGKSIQAHSGRRIVSSASGLVSIADDVDETAMSSWISDSLISPPKRSDRPEDRRRASDAYLDPAEYDIQMRDVTRRLQDLGVPKGDNSLGILQ
jgi:hypothetical protein